MNLRLLMRSMRNALYLMGKAVRDTFAISLAKLNGTEDELLDRLTDDKPLGRAPRPGDLLGPF